MRETSDEQLRDLLATRIPGTERSRLDRLAELIATQLEVQTCQIALHDDRLRVVGGSGLPDSQHDAVLPLEQTVCSLVQATGQPVRIADTATDPRTRDLDAVRAGQVGCYLGVPLRMTDGRFAGTLCAYEPGARHWTDSEEKLLTSLSASVVAEVELTMLTAQYQLDRAMWEVAVEAGGIGTFNLEVGTGDLQWDDRMIRLFGYSRAEFENLLSDAFHRVHPDDLPRVEAAVNEAVAAGADYADEYRVQLPGGRLRWLAARGRVLTDQDGHAERLIGAAYDITALREATERLDIILAGMPVGYLRLSHDETVEYVNQQAVATLGRLDTELVGHPLTELFPAIAGTRFEATYRRVIETGATETFDAYYPPPLDVWLEVRAVLEGEGVGLYFLDITARVHAREAADRARQRSELLAQLTAALARDENEDAALATIPQIVVPTMADWAIITVLTDRLREQRGSASPAATADGLRDIAASHRDPARQDVLRRFVEARMAAFREVPTMPAMTLRAATTGETTVQRTNATEKTMTALPPGASRDLLRELAPEAAAVVPLRARGQTLALLTLGWDDSSLASHDQLGPSDDDLAILTLIADRAGAALDNARMAAERRALAENLQRSLLTEPPVLDDLQIEVRYVPAAETAQVGGDWYDAFVRQDSGVEVVIGDVLGHDSHAAAAMGQIRSLVRATAVITDAGPAETLHAVDSALQTLRVGTSATSVVAEVRREESGTGHLLTWSNAGHPPPLIVRCDDPTVMILTADRPNMLLGVDPAAGREEHTCPLPPGSTLLMYTDGLVERRDQPFDVGIERLQVVLAELRQLDLAALCDAVVDQMVPGPHSDDVALIAVRTRPAG